MNEHGDLPPKFFFQVFAKNSLINNIFEEEKKFDSRTYFFWRKAPYWMYFDQGQDFKLTMELSEKVLYSPKQANQKQLKWSNTLKIKLYVFRVTKT